MLNVQDAKKEILWRNELKKERFFTDVQTGQNVIMLFGTNPPEKNVQNAVPFWLRQRENRLNVRIRTVISGKKKGEHCSPCD